MTIDRHDAAAALNLVARSQRQASELRGYANAGPILMGWGVAWFVANLASQTDPSWARIAWPVAILGAVAWSVMRPRVRFNWRILATVGVAVGHVFVTMALVRADPRLTNVLISLLVAGAYIVLGIWTGSRFALLGLVLATMVLIGWFVVPGWLFACLAFGGGGALFIGGWWLGRA